MTPPDENEGLGEAIGCTCIQSDIYRNFALRPVNCPVHGLQPKERTGDTPCKANTKATENSVPSAISSGAEHEVPSPAPAPTPPEPVSDTPETDRLWNRIVDRAGEVKNAEPNWKMVAVRMCEEAQCLERQRNAALAESALKTELLEEVKRDVVREHERLNKERAAHSETLAESARLRAERDTFQTELQKVCDHDWTHVDDSFDHEFGTEQLHSCVCEKCGATKPYEPETFGDEVI